MEPIAKAKKLFTSFGIQCILLPYYGYYDEWEILLKKANQASREFWSKQKSALWNLFQQNSLEILMYTALFDQQFADYILETPTAREYYLNVTLEVAEGNQEGTGNYSTFLKFLNDAKTMALKIRFEKIMMLRLPKDLTIVNKITRALIDMGIDKHVIKSSDAFVVSNEGELEYISRICQSGSLKYVKE